MYRVARGGAALAVAMMALGGISAAHAQQSSAPPAGTPSPSDGAALDPNSPMAPLPGLGVDWPDLATAPGAADNTQAEHAEIAADIRYSYAVKGLEDARDALLRQRFDDLSTLKAHQGDPANAAQLDRRAREDSDLLTALLSAQGYYDARVDTDVGISRRQARIVVLDAEPGARLSFRARDAGRGLGGGRQDRRCSPSAFGVAPGDPVNADAIAGGAAQMTHDDRQ